MTDSFFVVFVEDDDNDIQLTRRALSSGRMKVVSKFVHSLVELQEYFSAETQLSRTPIADVVVTDLKLNISDGFVVCEWLASKKAFSRIPIVILTSSNLIEDKVRAKELGASRFITKPGSNKVLSELLDQTFRDVSDSRKTPSHWALPEENAITDGASPQP